MKSAIVGYGKMGKLLKEAFNDSEEFDCVAIVGRDHLTHLNECKEDIEIIFDFSHPDRLSMILDYALLHQCKLVLGSSGYTTLQLGWIEEASKKIAIIQSVNFSLGITALLKEVKNLSLALNNTFDIEIIEHHHALKSDAPGGTSRLLFEALGGGYDYIEVNGRKGEKVRESNEIGIHAIRGGTGAGMHCVSFFGQDESIELIHRSTSRQIFINGAICAAKFLIEKNTGLYHMEEVIFGN